MKVLLIALVPLALLWYASKHRTGRVHRMRSVITPERRLHRYLAQRGDHEQLMYGDPDYSARHVQGLKVIGRILRTYPEYRHKHRVVMARAPKVKPALRRGRGVQSIAKRRRTTA